MENTTVAKNPSTFSISILHINRRAKHNIITSEIMNIIETPSRDYRMNCNIWIKHEWIPHSDTQPLYYIKQINVHFNLMKYINIIVVVKIRERIKYIKYLYKRQKKSDIRCHFKKFMIDVMEMGTLFEI